MASRGIKDRVAIIGMGCTKFGEHWDKSAEDLMVDAAYDAYASAGVDPNDIDAYWLGTMGSGVSGLTLRSRSKSSTSRLPASRICARPAPSRCVRPLMRSLPARSTCAMAIGVEKLKDSGFSGLVMTNPPNDGTPANMTPPALFSLLAPAYFKKYGLDPGKGQARYLARIAWKNHKNGAKQSQGAVPERSLDGRDQELTQDRRSTMHHGLLRRIRRLCRRDRGPRRRRAQVLQESTIYQGALLRRRTRRRTALAGVRFHQLPRSRRDRQAMLTRRPASPIRASSSASPRCTTASRRPSWCSTRTWASARAAPPGRT